MVRRWHGDGMEVAWRWHGDGMEIAWRWHGDGREVALRFQGDCEVTAITGGDGARGVYPPDELHELPAQGGANAGLVRGSEQAR